MKIFKDNAGREWQVAINVDSVKRVRSLLNVDLLDAQTKPFESIIADVVKLIDVLYAICKPQADVAGVSSEQFGEAMAGDALDAAVEAFVPEWISFFRSRQRAVLAKIWDKTQAAEKTAQEMIVKRLESPQFDQDVREAMENLINGPTFGPTSTAPPASSESTPAP